MPVVDVAAFVGTYPYRDLGRAGSADWLLGQMDRLSIDRAWVGYLPSVLHSDPAADNRALARIVASHQDRLAPIPTVNPDQPRWQDDLNEALSLAAPAMRVYPQYLGLDTAGDAMRVVAGAAAVARLPLVLTVRLEDRRQRHPADRAGELEAAAVRTFVRQDPQLRLLVTHADRAFIEEVHFGLTDTEAAQVMWDISWVWGPPEDQLRLLFETVGIERFAVGTGMPLRIGDAAFTKLDLLDLDESARASVLGSNIDRWASSDGHQAPDLS
jgi:predicted TIM-barrel fold metal-dependent hydrolase